MKNTCSFYVTIIAFLMSSIALAGDTCFYCKKDIKEHFSLVKLKDEHTYHIACFSRFTGSAPSPDGSSCDKCQSEAKNYRLIKTQPTKLSWIGLNKTVDFEKIQASCAAVGAGTAFGAIGGPHCGLTAGLAAYACTPFFINACTKNNQ